MQMLVEFRELDFLHLVVWNFRVLGSWGLVVSV